MNVGRHRVSCAVFSKISCHSLPRPWWLSMTTPRDAANAANAVLAIEVGAVELRIAFENRLCHRQPAKRCSEIDGVALILDSRGAADRDGGAAHELLGEIDHLHVVRVRLVELEHRELGVVLGGRHPRCESCD